jgi:hypothetical protein
MARVRKFSSTKQTSSSTAGGKVTSASHHKSDKLHMSAKVKPPGYSGGKGTAVAQPGGKQGFSSVKASRTGVVSSDTSSTKTAPTYRESFVSYNSTESSRPSIPTVAGTAIQVATPNQSPVPQGKGELVFAAGTALILLSGFTSKHIQAMLDLFTNAKNMKYTRQQARVGMVVVGGEFLFLMILTAISEQDDAFSNVALMLIFALFLVWGIQNVKTSTQWVDFITGKAKNI